MYQLQNNGWNNPTAIHLSPKGNQRHPYISLYQIYFSCVGSYKLIEIISNLFLEPTGTEQ